MIKSEVQNTSSLTHVLKPSFSKMWIEFEIFSFLTCLAVKCEYSCIPQRANPLCRRKRRAEKKSYFHKSIFCGKDYFLCPWKLNINFKSIYLFFKKSLWISCLSVYGRKNTSLQQVRETQTAPNLFLTISFKYLRNNYKKWKSTPTTPTTPKVHNQNHEWTFWFF